MAHDEDVTVNTHRIDGKARTVRELLHGARYTIDFYQREYAWQTRQVQELVDDLTGKFLDFYEPDHERREVESYGHYFLGSIVISHKRGQRFIVDGQQRLTTLTLFLIYLHRLQHDRADAVSVEQLIFSTKYGKRSFNMDVEERAACMDRLFTGEPFDASGAPESIKTMVGRYDDIASNFPNEVRGEALPYFIDWLLENVHLVEIEAYSDEDAYTIFETMNDRGLSLSLPEMLKGYVLANVRDETEQRQVNDTWKQHMQQFKNFGPEEDVDFFKNWLRGRFAQTARMGHGAENKDYERIGSEFHRWVRDKKEELGLSDSAAFVRFVQRDLDFYAWQTRRIRQAAVHLTSGLESIYFNDDRQFTSQTQALLSALEPSDSKDAVDQKLRLVSDYLDIWLARRAWNFRDTSQSTVRYTVFNLCKRLRDKSAEAISALLRADLDEDHENTFAKNPNLRLHQQNRRQIRHILARLTYWVDQQCGVATHFDDLISKAKSKPFEIEHIWPNHPEDFSDLFAYPSDFDRARNRIGGLLLLQRGPNQSLGDKPYVEKRDAYVSLGQSLLARSLHPLAYQNNPAFTAFIERTGLDFRPLETFGVDEQDARQELYLRIAEWVWNPSRLDLDGVKPPAHEPLEDPDDKNAKSPQEKGIRHQQRYAFWEKVLAYSKSINGIHGHRSPSGYHWIGYREKGFWWNMYVGLDHVWGDLNIASFGLPATKQIFDLLHAQRELLEERFGAPLEWYRLDKKIAASIAFTIRGGGWADESTWEVTSRALVEHMERLYKALREPALDARKKVVGS